MWYGDELPDRHSRLPGGFDGPEAWMRSIIRRIFACVFIVAALVVAYRCWRRGDLLTVVLLLAAVWFALGVAATNSSSRPGLD